MDNMETNSVEKKMKKKNKLECDGDKDVGRDAESEKKEEVVEMKDSEKKKKKKRKKNKRKECDNDDIERDTRSRKKEVEIEKDSVEKVVDVEKDCEKKRKKNKKRKNGSDNDKDIERDSKNEKKGEEAELKNDSAKKKKKRGMKEMKEAKCQEAAVKRHQAKVIGLLCKGVCPADNIMDDLMDSMSPQLFSRLTFSKLHGRVLSRLLGYAWRHVPRQQLFHMMFPRGNVEVHAANLMVVFESAVVNRKTNFLKEIFKKYTISAAVFRQNFRQLEYSLQDDIDNHKDYLGEVFTWLYEPWKFCRKHFEYNWVSLRMGSSLFKSLIQKLTHSRKPVGCDRLNPFVGLCLDYFNGRCFSEKLQCDWQFACQEAIEAGDYTGIHDVFLYFRLHDSWSVVAFNKYNELGESARRDRAAMLRNMLDSGVKSVELCAGRSFQGLVLTEETSLDDVHDNLDSAGRMFQDLKLTPESVSVVFDYLFYASTDKFQKLAEGVSWWISNFDSIIWKPKLELFVKVIMDFMLMTREEKFQILAPAVSMFIEDSIYHSDVFLDFLFRLDDLTAMTWLNEENLTAMTWLKEEKARWCVDRDHNTLALLLAFSLQDWELVSQLLSSQDSKLSLLTFKQCVQKLIKGRRISAAVGVLAYHSVHVHIGKNWTSSYEQTHSLAPFLLDESFVVRRHLVDSCLEAGQALWAVYFAIDSDNTVLNVDTLLSLASRQGPQCLSYMLLRAATCRDWELFDSLAAICTDPQGVIRVIQDHDLIKEWKWSSLKKLVDQCTDPGLLFDLLDTAVLHRFIDMAKDLMEKVNMNRFLELYPESILLELELFAVGGCNEADLEIICVFVEAGVSTVLRPAPRNADIYLQIHEGSHVSPNQCLFPHIFTALWVDTGKQLFELTKLLLDSGALSNESLDKLRRDPVLLQMLSDQRKRQEEDASRDNEDASRDDEDTSSDDEDASHDDEDASSDEDVSINESDVEKSHREYWIDSVSLVLERASNPGSLQQLARLAVSQAVGCHAGRSARIDELNLPLKMKNYVGFKYLTGRLEKENEAETQPSAGSGSLEGR